MPLIVTVKNPFVPDTGSALVSVLVVASVVEKADTTVFTNVLAGAALTREVVVAVAPVKSQLINLVRRLVAVMFTALVPVYCPRTTTLEIMASEELSIINAFDETDGEEAIFTSRRTNLDVFVRLISRCVANVIGATEDTVMPRAEEYCIGVADTLTAESGKLTLSPLKSTTS